MRAERRHRRGEVRFDKGGGSSSSLDETSSVNGEGSRRGSSGCAEYAQRARGGGGGIDKLDRPLAVGRVERINLEAQVGCSCGGSVLLMERVLLC